MEIASETILSGKAKVMVAGGFDDLCEEGSYEFGNMKATSNSETELAMGREPTEMSRPTTTTRAGVCLLIFLLDCGLLIKCPSVHGVPRRRCTHYHVSQNCHRAWLSNSWHSLFHLYVNVSLFMRLTICC